ncbi:MAG TPA: PQQ-dependent sugar dehydrogenase [Flavobacteriales bacterium]|jgi:glucose/arabinose dehydrogenase|nr:PQQ-dependent sugar dehydrogenase [Flavobacteriales bacterium]
MGRLSAHGPSAFVAFGLFAALSTTAQTTFTVGNTEIEATEVVTGLDVPWDLVLGPDGWIWFTQLHGVVSRLDPATGEVQVLYTEPQVFVTPLSGGLHSLAFHPDFANHPLVYLHYLTSGTTSVVRRYLWDADAHTLTPEAQPILDLHAGPSHNGSRIVIDDAGMMLISLGEAMSHSADAQNLNETYGKVLRFDPDGGIPADNPIPDSYVYSWGHRNPQGLVHAPNGVLYASEHGQANDDEVNIIEPNRNYGWPTVAGLCNTASEITFCNANNVREPIHEFTAEVVAPSGLDYFNNPSVPEWQSSLLVATLRGRELHQLKLNAAEDDVVEEHIFLDGTYGRLRDVLVMPDGRIFLCTSNHDYTGSSNPINDKIIVLTPHPLSTGVEAVGTSTNVRVYPNPVSDRLTVEASGAWRLTVRDVSGRVVLQQRAANTTQVDVSPLAPGVYRSTVEQGVQRTTASFVIQR